MRSVCVAPPVFHFSSVLFTTIEISICLMVLSHNNKRIWTAKKGQTMNQYQNGRGVCMDVVEQYEWLEAVPSTKKWYSNSPGKQTISRLCVNNSLLHSLLIASWWIIDHNATFKSLHLQCIWPPLSNSKIDGAGLFSLSNTPSDNYVRYPTNMIIEIIKHTIDGLSVKKSLYNKNNQIWLAESSKILWSTIVQIA